MLVESIIQLTWRGLSRSHFNIANLRQDIKKKNLSLLTTVNRLNNLQETCTSETPHGDEGKML